MRSPLVLRRIAEESFEQERRRLLWRDFENERSTTGRVWPEQMMGVCRFSLEFVVDSCDGVVGRDGRDDCCCCCC